MHYGSSHKRPLEVTDSTEDAPPAPAVREAVRETEMPAPTLAAPAAAPVIRFDFSKETQEYAKNPANWTYAAIHIKLPESTTFKKVHALFCEGPPSMTNKDWSGKTFSMQHAKRLSDMAYSHVSGMGKGDYKICGLRDYPGFFLVVPCTGQTELSYVHSFSKKNREKNVIVELRFSDLPAMLDKQSQAIKRHMDSGKILAHNKSEDFFDLVKKSTEDSEASSTVSSGLIDVVGIDDPASSTVFANLTMLAQTAAQAASPTP
jgi:hypothetical protein